MKKSGHLFPRLTNDTRANWIKMANLLIFNQYKRSIYLDLLIISFLWLTGLLITSPFGNFPLNDDWSYALTVKHLIETGEFHPIGWTSMPLLSHTIWGYLFCIPMGFSFEALRLSTITMALAGVFGTYFLVKEITETRFIAVFTATSLAFNPVFYSLSNTYMTDVPFASIAILATFFFVKFLNNENLIYLIIATVLIVIATLNRQLALAVPLAFMIAYVLRSGGTIQTLTKAISPLILCTGVLLAFNFWLTATERTPALYSTKTDELLQTAQNQELLNELIWNTFASLLYIGLFILPILVIVVGNVLPALYAKKKKFFFLLFLALLIATLLSLKLGFPKNTLLMPLKGNILDSSGIGPFTLRDMYFLNTNNMHELPKAFWIATTILSLNGATILILAVGAILAKLIPRFWPKKMDTPQTINCFLILCTGFYLAPILLTHFFDRYLIIVLPFIATATFYLIPKEQASFNTTTGKAFTFAATLTLGLTAIFSITATHDYLAWNRTRWEILENLTQKTHIKASKIDGGFEFNGWNLYDPKYKNKPGKSWWWVIDDQFLVAFGPIPGYSVIGEHAYKQWLSPNNSTLVLLKKEL